MRLSILAAFVLSSAAAISAHAENLLDIYQTAQQKDPIVLQAKAERDSAYAAIDYADSANLPQINLNGNIGYQKTNKDDLNTAMVAGGSLSLQQSIWRHSNFLRSSIAEKQATGKDLDYNNAKQRLIQRVCTAYFGVLEAQEVLEYTEANKKALKRQYDEANQRFKVGLIANTDVQETKAAYDLATAQVILAQNSLANSYELLREITGSEHKDLDRLNVSTFSTPGVQKDPTYWLKTAEENNMLLQAMMVNREVAKENISLAQTGHEPTLDLVGSLSSNYTDYKENTISKQDGTINAGTIGLELNIPIYSGGAVSAQVEQAKANYVAASEALEAQHRTVQTDLFSQYNNINAAIGTVKAYEQTVISAQSALDATTAGYEVGTRTIVDVLDATQKLYNAKSSLASARYKYIMSWVNLRYTSGLLNEEDITNINSVLSKK